MLDYRSAPSAFFLHGKFCNFPRGAFAELAVLCVLVLSKQQTATLLHCPGPGGVPERFGRDLAALPTWCFLCLEMLGFDKAKGTKQPKKNQTNKS